MVSCRAAFSHLSDFEAHTNASRCAGSFCNSGGLGCSLLDIPLGEDMCHTLKLWYTDHNIGLGCSVVDIIVLV